MKKNKGMLVELELVNEAECVPVYLEVKEIRGYKRLVMHFLDSTNLAGWHHSIEIRTDLDYCEDEEVSKAFGKYLMKNLVKQQWAVYIKGKNDTVLLIADKDCCEDFVIRNPFVSDYEIRPFPDVERGE